MQWPKKPVGGCDPSIHFISPKVKVIVARSYEAEWPRNGPRAASRIIWSVCLSSRLICRCCISVDSTHHRDEPGFTNQERMDAQIAVYANMVESVMALVHAVEQLRDDPTLPQMQAEGDEALIHEQGKIVEQYGNIIFPFYKGNTQ